MATKCGLDLHWSAALKLRRVLTLSWQIRNDMGESHAGLSRPLS